MRSSAFYALCLACLLLLLILLKPLSTSRSSSLPITERLIDGYAELSSQWISLQGYRGDHGEAVDWSAQVSADPSKAPFVLTFRNSHPSRERWGNEVKHPVAVIVGTESFRLRPYEEAFGHDGIDIASVRFHGPRSALRALAGMKSAQIEFGGNRYEIDDLGLATFRELLKRSLKSLPKPGS